MLKGLKKLKLQTFLVALLLLYLFVPIHKDVLTMLHTLSHHTETLLKARQEHLNKHNHHFMVSSNHHEQQHDHVSNHHHSHSATNHHKHDYITLLASFFSSAENNTHQEEKRTTLLQFDKHILPNTYHFQRYHVLIPRKTNWGIPSCYYSIHLSINLPPPKAS